MCNHPCSTVTAFAAEARYICGAIREPRKVVELGFADVNYWDEWIKGEVFQGGVDPPDEEGSLLFATRAVTTADALLSSARNSEDILITRDQLIEALVVQQCWHRSVELRRKEKTNRADESPLPLIEGREVVARKADGLVMLGSDSHHYLASFAGPERRTALATEVICLELARTIGLPVPPIRLLRVDHHLASRAGALPACRGRTAAATPTFLGIRELPDEKPREGLPSLPLSASTSRYLAGKLTLDVLTLNLVPDDTTFRVRRGRLEPIFKHFRHCLMDANWNHFIRAKPAEPVPLSFVDRIRSYEQIETWIRRIERVDLERICEVAVKLPPDWYGNWPTSVAAVIVKLIERTGYLRESVLRLLRTAGLGLLHDRPSEPTSTRTA
jgi:hypothetical protein